ncbi:hypothetical protein T492DRAFT_901185 [Pavlovales sp. CCMP2436]|nr:hypothetical protein T492DRAFT_901185 [Pavlovales sp. CCMP2436]
MSVPASETGSATAAAGFGSGFLAVGARAAGSSTTSGGTGSAGRGVRVFEGVRTGGTRGTVEGMGGIDGPAVTASPARAAPPELHEKAAVEARFSGKYHLSFGCSVLDDPDRILIQILKLFLVQFRV